MNPSEQEEEELMRRLKRQIHKYKVSSVSSCSFWARNLDVNHTAEVSYKVTRLINMLLWNRLSLQFL